MKMLFTYQLTVLKSTPSADFWKTSCASRTSIFSLTPPPSLLPYSRSMLSPTTPAADLDAGISTPANEGCHLKYIKN
jgi:hypothetical protein